MGLVNTWSSLHRDLHKNRLCSGNSGRVHRSRDCRCELRRWGRQAWASRTKDNCEGARDMDGGAGRTQGPPSSSSPGNDDSDVDAACRPSLSAEDVVPSTGPVSTC